MDALLDGSGLLDGKTFHEPPELSGIDSAQFGFCPRPLETAVAQALVEQQVAVSGPIERLDSIRPPAAEKEQAVLTQRQAVLQHDDGRQAVDALSQVHVPHRNVIVADSAQVNHGAEWNEAKP